MPEPSNTPERLPDSLSASPNEFSAKDWPSYRSRLAHWSDKRKDAVRRVWAGKGSPRNAIKFMCLECTGEALEAITTCADRWCPLWNFRPFQTKTTKVKHDNP